MRGLVCQVESVPWISNMCDVKLIIFDEIDSILTHIESNQRGVDPFINLLRTEGSHAPTKIFMDAFMTQQTINVIENLSNSDGCNVIHNDFKKMQNHTYKIYDYTKSNQDKTNVVTSIQESLRAGLKVVSSVSNWNIADLIYQNLKDEFKICYYHGDEYRIDQDEENKEMYHREIKK